MADWAAGYAASWRVTRVNEETWADEAELAGVESVSVSRRCTDEVPLLEEGTMTVSGEVEEGTYRIWMTADGERWPVATLLFAPGPTDHEYGSLTECAGRSVLAWADDERLRRGTYAPKGADGAAYAASLLRSVLPGPVEVEGSFTLNGHVVFAPGTTCLEAVWLVLSAGGFCMQIDGDGTVHVRPLPGEPALELSRANASLLLDGIRDDPRLDGVPNRYTASDGAEAAEATNEDPDSETSRPARGRWVDAYDDSPVPVNGETLAAYARRRLHEASTVTRERSYSREWWPGVVPYSLVRGSMADVGLDGDMRVLSQSLECGAGIVVSEVAGLEVSYA